MTTLPDTDRTRVRRPERQSFDAEALAAILDEALIAHVGALVLARSGFDHSMNYRSEVVIGVPELVPEEEKPATLGRVVDHLVPGRTGELRASHRKELAATVIVRLPLATGSVKIRAAGAGVEPGDGEDRSVWAGVVPLRTVAGDPIAEPDVPAAVAVPASVRALARRYAPTASHPAPA